MGADQNVAEEVRRCRCGHDKRHPWVRPEKHYTPWGQLAFSILFTPLPKRIDLRCGVCQEIVGSITDPEELQKFRYREPRRDER